MNPARLALALLALVPLACGGSSSGAPDTWQPPADVVEAADTPPVDATADAEVAPQPVYTDAPYDQAVPYAWSTAEGLPSDDVRLVTVDALGHAWAGGAWGLAKFTGLAWAPFALRGGDQPAVIDVQAMPDRNLWVLAADDLYVVTPDGLSRPAQIDVGQGVAIGAGNGEVWLLSDKGVCRATITPADVKPTVTDWVAPPAGVTAGLGRDVAGGAETGSAFVAVEGTLWHLQGDAWAEVPLGVTQLALRNLARAADGTVWVASTAGLFRLLLGKIDAVTLLTGDQGLPFLDVAHVELGANGEVVVAFAQGGAASWAKGRWDLWHSRIWLPSTTVRAATLAASGGLWAATDAGVGEVRPVPMTLYDKARTLEDDTYAHHVRLGYVAGVGLPVPGDLSSAVTHDDDNDGQWTGMWLAALSFEFAVTRNPETKARAVEASQALRFLEAVTPRPGFFARSVLPIDQCADRLAGDPEQVGEWHESDDHQWCWKGNTSSDEFVGHVYGQSVYYDLVADDAEKQAVAAYLGRIVDDITTGGGTEFTWRIVDVDGQPTTDGHFDPDFLGLVGQYGDAGLNGAMILGGLLAAHHMTGEERYLASYRLLRDDEGYGEWVRREKEIQDMHWINHDSDEMAFMAFLALLWNETDPDARAVWLEGLEALWQTQRPERNPEFNLTWALLSKRPDIDLEATVETLRLIPTRLVNWAVANGDRLDVTIDPEPDRFGNEQLTEVVPYDEHGIMKWNSNPFRSDVGGDGTSAEASTYWILPYWMGRYAGVISKP
jgi:hypothetical protein